VALAAGLAAGFFWAEAAKGAASARPASSKHRAVRDKFVMKNEKWIK